MSIWSTETRRDSCSVREQPGYAKLGCDPGGDGFETRTLEGQGDSERGRAKKQDAGWTQAPRHDRREGSAPRNQDRPEDD